jgi:hypothetical protein
MLHGENTGAGTITVDYDSPIGPNRARNDMDTYAADVAELNKALDLKNAGTSVIPRAEAR